MLSVSFEKSYVRIRFGICRVHLQDGAPGSFSFIGFALLLQKICSIAGIWLSLCSACNPRHNQERHCDLKSDTPAHK